MSYKNKNVHFQEGGYLPFFGGHLFFVV